MNSNIVNLFFIISLSHKFFSYARFVVMHLYRSAIEKKNAEEKKPYQAIDYDTPIESDKSTIGFGTKVRFGFQISMHELIC